MSEANGNGVVDLARDEVPQGEIGTAVDSYERIFKWEDANAPFTASDVAPRDIDNMLRLDGKARKLEQVLTLPMQVPHSIEPAEGDSGEADFIREALEREANAGGMSTPLSLVLAQATGAVLYRRVFFEKVFKAEEGRVLYDKIAWRPPGSCAIKRDRKSGAFQGFTQRVGDDYPRADDEGKVTIPAERAFVFINGKHRNPLRGTSDLDTAYQLWTLKQKVRFLYFTFLENQTMPKAIAKVDSSDAREANKLANKVASLRGGGVVGITKDQSVEAYENSTAAGDAFRAAIAMLDAEIADSVLAGFSELSSNAQSGRGSFALAKSDTDLFLQSRQSVLNALGSEFTAWVIADLIRWNFGSGRPVPRLGFGPLVREHAEVAIDLLKEFAAKDSPNVPEVFIGELVVKVAQLLGMDEAKVEEGFRSRIAVGSDPVAQLRAGANAATQMIREAGLAQA